MKYTYETTYEDCSPDGTVRVSAEVRFTYTVIWGCPARIHYDGVGSGNVDSVEIVKTEIENFSLIPGKPTWRETSKDEHEILCSWVDNSCLCEFMLEDARVRKWQARRLKENGR